MKKLRIIIDITMTAVLLCLMSYSLIGELTHEVLGVAMAVLLTIHHILNRRWFRVLIKGPCSAFRIFQTVLVFLLFLSVMGSAISGIILSGHLFLFLDPTEPILFFFLDYLAIMGLFVICGHYLGKILKKLDRRSYEKNH